MFYLSGERTPELDEVVELQGGGSPGAGSPDLGIGLIMQPLTASFVRYAHVYPVCAIDNGCFTEVGRRRFSMASYLDLIARGLAAWGDRLLFATAPDVVGDWEETKRQSLPELRRIRKAGCPAALVLQDGATLEEFNRDNLWDRCDAVFIGGSTEWKLGKEAARLGLAARRPVGDHRRTKWVHMGRVNSLTRMRLAYPFCDSVDGTYLLHMPADEGVTNIVRWMREMHRLQVRAEVG